MGEREKSVPDLKVEKIATLAETLLISNVPGRVSGSKTSGSGHGS